jgi:hypothetical protein
MPDSAGLQGLSDLRLEGEIEPEAVDFPAERFAAGKKGIAPKEILVHEGTMIPRATGPLP